MQSVNENARVHAIHCTYLEDDVGDVENREHRVVIIASEAEIPLQSRDSSIADICSINKAE